MPPLCFCLRLVASRQEEHQGIKAQSAEAMCLSELHDQRQTAASMSQAHATQPGPGEHRAEGPRSELSITVHLAFSLLRNNARHHMCMLGCN